MNAPVEGPQSTSDDPPLSAGEPRLGWMGGVFVGGIVLITVTWTGFLGWEVGKVFALW